MPVSSRSTRRISRSARRGIGCSAHRPGFGYIGTGVPELIIGVRPIWRAGSAAPCSSGCASGRAEGFGRISLSVERGNFAQTLYRSEGFAVTQAGHGRDTMVKRLR
jgi:hypothetical protein